MPNRNNSISRRQAFILGAGAVSAVGAIPPFAAAADEKPVVLVVGGPSTHPPGTHEVAAGARILGHCIDSAGVGLKAEVLSDWPRGTAERSAVTAVVFIGDLFPPEVMPDRERIMTDLSALMKRGCGLVCVHYATGLGAKQVPADGAHPLLDWMGGYFATRCPHHQSVAKVFAQATIDPATGDHPVLRGWKKFTLHDEPYINNYFGKDGPAPGVTILATSMLPPEKPKAEPVAWAIQRKDGGRGTGIVMPHFYRNWRLPDLRMLILNSIVWCAGKDVPKNGASVELPELESFKPAAVEPPAKKK